MKNQIIGGLVIALLLTACDRQEDAVESTETAQEVQEVNVYTSRHYDTDLALYDNFTAATGIKVNLIEAGADELIERIVSEGEFSPADLLVTVDAGRLWRAEEAGLFDPVESEILNERVPAKLRHPDGPVVGLSKRARVIIYGAAGESPSRWQPTQILPIRPMPARSAFAPPPISITFP